MEFEKQPCDLCKTNEAKYECTGTESCGKKYCNECQGTHDFHHSYVNVKKEEAVKKGPFGLPITSRLLMFILIVVAVVALATGLLFSAFSHPTHQSFAPPKSTTTSTSTTVVTSIPETFVNSRISSIPTTLATTIPTTLSTTSASTTSTSTSSTTIS